METSSAMVELIPLPGERIKTFAKLLIAERTKLTQVTYGSFNGIELIAKWGKADHVLTGEYYKRLRKSSDVYLNSDRHKFFLKQEEEAQVRRVATAERLILEFETLDFSDEVAVLLWMYQAQDISDRNLIPNPVVFDKLILEGYKINENIKEAFNGEDRINYARYIIGQALSFMETIPFGMHKMVYYAVEEWAEQFNVTLPEV
jgi:hypothetical protein